MRWIWGAGEGGRLTRVYEPDAIGLIDSNPALWGQERHGLPVRGPELLLPGDHVVIATLWARDVVAAMPREVTWSLTPLWRSLDPSPVYWLREHDEVLAGLADDESWEVYRYVVAAWVWDAPSVVGEPGGYDLDLLGIQHARRAIDGGPYDGSEIREWLAVNPGLRVTAVDPVIRPGMVELADRVPGVDWVRGVLSADLGPVLIREAGPASGVSRASGEEHLVEAYSLADLGPADVVKLDIEGAEAALIDASLDYLREHLPRLAVCIYHRHSDLHTIPLALMRGIGDRYSYHVRHHSQGLPETVLYCVPRRES
jgi:hypothetical protein